MARTMSRPVVQHREQEPAEEQPVPLSDPQEIVDLPRREGRPLDRAQIAREIRAVRQLLEDKETSDAVFAHRVGSALKLLYTGFAERVHGHATFADFAQKTFDLSRTDAHVFPRIAHHFSEAECLRLRMGRLRRYLSFFGYTGLTSWEALRQRTFPTPDGTHIRLDDTPLPTVAEIDSALTLLRAADRSTTPSTRQAQAKAGRLGEAFLLARADNPALEGVRVSFIAQKSKVIMKSGPLDDAQRVALARFILKMERE